ncbi:asparagine synthase-related protein [Rossellomorea aquimaris]|uniref:asparagine synthase (glutamine-hydrolyzing) n=1 Tax=Rossellomorea aquimaris TaxID=189382 RepID=A0A366EL55_9BACI|nr:asparagine synthase-related protein [Rossellomorea aquimaris]RBP03162.1 asparagine synthase (glutamine-hydrolysing) [Rossellomorea aquimaris]
MSAIAGIYHQNHEPVSREHIHAMMGSLEQFPADDVRVYKKDHIFLGCHAQWITPESIGEVLPFYDNERKLAITADAIIDNRKDLFNTLGVRQSFRKEMSDSELILLAYEKWEEDCPKYLVGDFAFVVWDERKRKLFAARDFSGARTLYYYFDQQCFAFCTVMAPLLSLPFIKRDMDEEWLAEFLFIQDMIDVVDVSKTIHKNIKQIPPAYSLTIEGGRVNLERYCRVVGKGKLKLKDTSEYVEAFKEVFQESINSKLRTFRKVGSHLSGGIDSGSVASFAAASLKNENKKLYTYSYVPEDNFVDWTPKYRVANETPQISETINHIGNVESEFLSFKGRNSLKEIDDWLDVMEMPYKFFENSFWVKGILEEGQEQGIGVMLNGARGNLGVSWGPALDYYAILLKKFKWVHLNREVNQYSTNVGVLDKKRIYSLISKKAFPIMKKVLDSSQPYNFPDVINNDFVTRHKVKEKLDSLGYELNSTKNIYELRKEHFEQNYVWNTTGTSNSKLSLRYSIWNRDPTNDMRVIKYCLSVPEEQYVQNGMDRSLIRNATEGFLPDQVRLNQQKRGIQGADWLYRLIPDWGRFNNDMDSLVKDPLMYEYFNVEKIKSILSKYRSEPLPEQAFNPELRILMRSLIVYRFIKKQF